MSFVCMFPVFLPCDRVTLHGFCFCFASGTMASQHLQQLLFRSGGSQKQ